MSSVEEAIEMAQKHLDGIREMKTQLQQFKGQIQIVRSQLNYLQDNHNAEAFSPELDPTDIAKARTGVERIADVVNFFIEKVENIRDSVRNMMTVCSRAQTMTNSLTDIDEELPETLESLDSDFQEIQTSVGIVTKLVNKAISILNQFPIVIVTSPESERISETISVVSEQFREMTQYLQLE